MQILLSLIFQEIVDQYELALIEDNGWIYIRIQKGVPVLLQAGKIANDGLEKHLGFLFLKKYTIPLRF